MGFIKWPQFYAAEAEKLKGGIFNDRKCINEFSNTVALCLSSLDAKRPYVFGRNDTQHIRFTCDTQHKLHTA